MRMLILAATAAAATIAAATPALADSNRVEIQSGVGWGNGQNTLGTIGGLVGHDFSLGAGAFAGAEVSVDKQLASYFDADVNFTGRMGLKPTPNDKVYALAGYTVNAQADASHVGAGWEHSFAGPLFGSLEYRHFFTTEGMPDSNRMMAGVGVHF